MAPHKAVYEKPLPIVQFYIPDISEVDVVDTTIKERDTILCQLRLNLQVAQEPMKHFIDKHRTKREFQLGD